MVNNLDYIIRWLYDMGVKKFCVWEAGKGKDENGRMNGNALKLTGDEPFEEKIETFKDWCANNTGSFIIVQQDGNSYNSELKFMLPFRGLPQQPAETPTSITGVPPGYYSEREFEARLENERLKMRLERLEQEAKAYREEAQQNSSAANDFFKQITPFVGPVLQGIFGKRTAAQIGSLDIEERTEEETKTEIQPGTNQDEELDIPDELFKRLTDDLKRWKADDPEYLDLIHKLSTLTKDPMYPTAKTMILNR